MRDVGLHHSPELRLQREEIGVFVVGIGNNDTLIGIVVDDATIGNERRELKIEERKVINSDIEDAN